MEFGIEKCLIGHNETREKRSNESDRIAKKMIRKLGENYQDLEILEADTIK